MPGRVCRLDSRVASAGGGGDSVRADQQFHPIVMFKEVTMVKRVLVVAGVLAALLLVAAPAFAFNGYRGDYTTSDFCSICHKEGQPGSAPKVYDQWAATQHGQDPEGASAIKGLPYGSVCAGCHTANYAASVVIPTPTATSTTGAVSWGASNGAPILPQNLGNAASSELDIGCASCHYGATTGDAPQYGNDPNDTAHLAPQANLANAAICGQCHSRYSYTVNTYAVSPVPYVKVTTPLPGTPITPNPSPTSLIQPQMAIGYPMLGAPTAGPGSPWGPVAPLSDYLNVPYPGWSPTPSPGVTSAAGLELYWKDATTGLDTPWISTGHDGSAAQYTDWSGGADKHAQALVVLKAVMGPNPPATCLECHSTDYRIAPDNAKPTGAQTQYGITCVGCHKPHDRGTAKGIWNPEFTPQLITDGQKTLCVTCHNGEIPDGSTASPGADVHHPMKEMMDGYGAIDVPAFPSVHKGKCVQCHMPPTTLSRGEKQLGANHTFKIITPGQADNVKPVTSGTAAPFVNMPFSACTTCHSRPGDDAALWLQDTIDQRQSWTHMKVDEIHAALADAAVRLGYANEMDARNALVAIPEANRTDDQETFLKAYTNVQYVSSEGSFGLHNWDYSRSIVNTALVEANSVKTAPAPAPWTVSFKASPTSLKKNAKTTFSGSVSPASSLAWGGAKVKIQKKVSGAWQDWKSATANGSGDYSLSVKMTSKGTFYFRALMPANSKQLEGASAQVKVVVK